MVVREKKNPKQDIWQDTNMQERTLHLPSHGLFIETSQDMELET